MWFGPPHGSIPMMRDRQPAVYIMASDYLGTLYTGASSDLIGRVIQHREEAFGGFAAEHGCKRLVWYDAADTMFDAITHEKRLKRWRRDWKTMLIERTNPTWDDLAISLGLPPLEP